MELCLVSQAEVFLNEIGYQFIDSAFDHMELCLVLQAEVVLSEIGY